MPDLRLGDRTLVVLKSFGRWGVNVTFASTLPLAFGGLGLLLSGLLAIDRSLGFVGGFLVGLPASAIFSESATVVQYRLGRAARLRDRGYLTAEEYERFRKRITARYSK